MHEKCVRPDAGPDQCRLCEHAHWRGNRVVACQSLAGERASPRVAAALEVLLFSLAGDRVCPLQAPWQAHPDAYFAADLPDTSPPLMTQEAL